MDLASATLSINLLGVEGVGEIHILPGVFFSFSSVEHSVLLSLRGFSNNFKTLNVRSISHRVPFYRDGGEGCDQNGSIFFSRLMVQSVPSDCIWEQV